MHIVGSTSKLQRKGSLESTPLVLQIWTLPEPVVVCRSVVPISAKWREGRFPRITPISVADGVVLSSSWFSLVGLDATLARFGRHCDTRKGLYFIARGHPALGPLTPSRLQHLFLLPSQTLISLSLKTMQQEALPGPDGPRSNTTSLRRDSASPLLPHGAPRSRPSLRTRARKKSAVACNTCRARRTKCDSQRPSCSYCQPRGIDCHYPQPAETPATRYESTQTADLFLQICLKLVSWCFSGASADAVLADMRLSLPPSISDSIT